MLDAIYMVEADLHNASLTMVDAAQRYQHVLSQLQDFPLPAPSHCGLECTTKPICYTGLRLCWFTYTMALYIPSLTDWLPLTLQTETIIAC